MSTVGMHSRKPGPRSRHTRWVRVDVHYPVTEGDLVLRADPDWNRDIEPVRSDGAGHFSFAVAARRPFVYFKPVLHTAAGPHWSVGDNYLALASRSDATDVYPHFRPDETCSACELQQLADEISGRRHAYRVFYPPGYHENTLRRFPVIYMHDGQNLFFPDEAFQGRHWQIAETLARLDAMNATRQVIVVGIYPNERQEDYTAPGYEGFGQFLVEHLKPCIDRGYRTLSGPESTAVMGSSLGGVVSFHLAWRYPGVFGHAACMSSTFGWRDDLFQRVRSEPVSTARFYLDSGWPGDNFEVTREMRALMSLRGLVEGRDFFYFAFPGALHDESHWAARTHLPLQLFFSSERRDALSTDAWSNVR